MLIDVNEDECNDYLMRNDISCKRCYVADDNVERILVQIDKYKSLKRTLISALAEWSLDNSRSRQDYGRDELYIQALYL